MKVYIAGLLWEEKDRKKLEEINKVCERLGFSTYLPHRDAGIYEKGDSKSIFTRNKDEIDGCDFMVALLDWKDIGSGTAWDVGYAYAKGKKIIGIVEDLKSVNKEFRTCVMCVNSVKLIEMKDLRKELEKIK